MKTIVRIDPLHEIRSFAHAMDRLFEQTPAQTQTQWIPLDVVETEQHFVVRASVPGVKPEHLQLQVEEGVLTLAAEAPEAFVAEGDRVYRREIRSGTFRRSLRLPENLDLDSASASQENGILEVRFARIPEPAPRVIKIGVQPTLESTTEPSAN